MKATSAHFLQGRNLAWIAFTTTITVVSLIFFSPLSTFSARAEQPSEVSAELSDIKDWNSKSEEWLEEHPPLQEPVVSRLLTGIKGQLEQNPELVAGGEGWALGEDSPTAYEIDNGFLLSVPVTGNNVVRGSFVAFSLDQDGIISSVNQIILQDIGASDRGRMTVYRDGKMTKDVIVIQADDTEIQLPEGTKSITTGIKVASIMATGVLHQMAFIPKAGWSSMPLSLS